MRVYLFLSLAIFDLLPYLASGYFSLVPVAALTVAQVRLFRFLVVFLGVASWVLFPTATTINYYYLFTPTTNPVHTAVIPSASSTGVLPPQTPPSSPRVLSCRQFYRAHRFLIHFSCGFPISLTVSHQDLVVFGIARELVIRIIILK